MNNNPFPPGAFVVAYVRDSGGEEQDQSVLQQETSIRSFCLEQSLILTQVFRDVARPGSSTVGRDGFQAMMAYFRHGATEAGLVVWSYSRFARSVDDSTFYRADLRRRGYVLHSLSDSIPEGNIGRLFEAIIDWKSAVFLEDLSRDVKRGLADLVSRYGAVPGTPPRGFTRQPVEIGSRRDGHAHIVHRWVPDPELAPVVRQAFEMLLSGSSLKEIQAATRLYGSVNSFKTFYTNPLYKGRLEFGDLVIDDYCEPVVPPETWDMAQAILARRAQRRHLAGDNPQHPRRNGRTYLLSGILYCARCGSPMFGMTTGGKARHVPNERYTCSRASRNHDCDAKSIPRIFVDELVTRTIREQILDPVNLADRQDILLQLEGQRQEELQQARSELRQRLANVRRNITNITETLAESGKSRALLSKLADLEGYEAELIAEGNQIEIQARHTVQSYTPDQFVELSDRLSANLDQRMLRGLFKRIAIERLDKTILLHLEYYYPPEDKPPNGIIQSISYFPVGAPSHRRTFSLDLSVTLVRKKRVLRKNASS